MMQTQVMTDAGKHAVFNEDFILQGIQEPILCGDELILKAYDEDVVTNELLGMIWAVPYQDFVKSEETMSHELDLFNDKKKKIGSIKFQTTFIIGAIAPPPPKEKRVEMSRIARLWKGLSVEGCEISNEAMRKTFQIKTMKHNNLTVESRIMKLAKEE